MIRNIFFTTYIIGIFYLRDICFAITIIIFLYFKSNFIIIRRYFHVDSCIIIYIHKFTDLLKINLIN